MATYAGYQAISAPDFSAPFREQLAGLTARREKEAERKFLLEREDQKIKRAERDKVDASYKDALVKIATASQTDYPDETFQGIVYNAADSERQLLVNAYGDYEKGLIDIKTYNKIEANIISDLTALSMYSTNAGAVAEEQSDRIQQGTAGYREKERAIYNQELSNLNNKRIAPDADGHLMLQTLDKNGDVIATNSIMNMTSGNNLSNQFSNKIDISNATEEIASKAASYVTGGSTKISDPRKNPKFNDYVKREIDMLIGVGTPQKNANILDLMGDGAMTNSIEVNGVEVDIPLNTFRTEKEKDDKIEATLQNLIDQDDIQLDTEEDANNLREEIEKMMVPITIEGGKDVYNTSTFHEDLVRDTLRKDIESKIDYQKTRTSTGTSGGGLTKTQKIDKRVTKISNAAWNNRAKQIAVGEDDEKAVKNHSSFEDLDKAYLYEYDPNINAIKIYKRTWSSGFETTLKNDPERVAFSAEDLSPYATSIARAQTSFEEGGGESGAGSGKTYKGIDPETGLPIYE